MSRDFSKGNLDIKLQMVIMTIFMLVLHVIHLDEDFQNINNPKRKINVKIACFIN